MKSLGRKYSFLEAKAKIEYWCAYQERAHTEVEKKLYDYGLDKEDVHALIAHLITENYLNEQRFASAYASGKHRIKKWGRTKIKIHLKQKKVSDVCIKQALNDLDADEYLENLYSVSQKKWESLKGIEWQKKAKLKNYLLSRGYEYDLIEDVIEKIF